MNDIDDIFKSSVERYRENPPDRIWAGIENKLDKEDMSKYKAKYFALARVVACFVLFAGSYMLYDDLMHRSNSNEMIPPTAKTNFINPKDNTIVSLLHEHTSLKETITGTVINRDAEAAMNYPTTVEDADKSFSPEAVYVNKSAVNAYPILILGDGIKENYPAITSAPLSIAGGRHIEMLKVNSVQNTPVAAQATTARKLTGQGGRFSATGFFSPDMPGSNLHEEYCYNNEAIPDISEGEKNKFSFTTGAFAAYRFSKRWSIESGFSFSSLTTSIGPKTLVADVDVDGQVKFQLLTSYGLINIKNAKGVNPQVGDSLRLANNTYLQLDYFTIPFLFKYHLATKGRFDLNASFGGGINFITDADSEIMVPNNSNTGERTESVKEIEGLRKNNYNAMVSFEALYHYNKKISFSLQPVLKYSLTPLTQNTPIKNLPYNIGFMAGVTIPL